MATSGIVRFAKREPGVSFSEHPNDWQAQFYVHYDGNVESLGLDIANSILNRKVIDEWEIDELHVLHSDAEYCYYIWQARDKDTWISIFKINQGFYCEHCNEVKGKEDECIFVGKPEKLKRNIANIDYNWNGEKITCM